MKKMLLYLADMCCSCVALCCFCNSLAAQSASIDRLLILADSYERIEKAIQLLKPSQSVISRIPLYISATSAGFTPNTGQLLLWPTTASTITRIQTSFGHRLTREYRRPRTCNRRWSGRRNRRNTDHRQVRANPPCLWIHYAVWTSEQNRDQEKRYDLHRPEDRQGREHGPEHYLWIQMGNPMEASQITITKRYSGTDLQFETDSSELIYKKMIADEITTQY